MGTRLIYDLCEALAEAGFQAWRFNFRGVGRSEGTYGFGVGELDDARAVFGRAREWGVPIMVGFSFGASIAAYVAAEAEVPVVMIAPPAQLRDTEIDTTTVMAKVPHAAIIWGDEDQQVPRDHFDAVVAAANSPDVHVIEGGDHFLSQTHHAEAIAMAVEAVRRAVG